MSSSFVPKIVSSDDHHRRGDQRCQRAPTRTSRRGSRSVADLRGDPEHDRVEDEHEQEAADQRVGQPQRRHERWEERVQDRDQRGGDDRPAEPVDRDVRDEVRGDQQRERGDQPGENDARRPEARARRSPAWGARRRRRSSWAEARAQSKVADPPGGSIRTSTPGTSSATCCANSSAGARSTEPRPPFQESPE